jgi:hypothetical protein
MRRRRYELKPTEYRGRLCRRCSAGRLHPRAGGSGAEAAGDGDSQRERRQEARKPRRSEHFAAPLVLAIESSARVNRSQAERSRIESHPGGGSSCRRLAAAKSDQEPRLDQFLQCRSAADRIDQHIGFQPRRVHTQLDAAVLSGHSRPSHPAAALKAGCPVAMNASRNLPA